MGAREAYLSALVSCVAIYFVPGNAPSLKKAYIIRELDVIEKIPAKNMDPNITTYIYNERLNHHYLMTVRTLRLIAPFSPTVSNNIWVTGWPVADVTVACLVLRRRSDYGEPF